MGYEEREFLIFIFFFFEISRKYNNSMRIRIKEGKDTEMEPMVNKMGVHMVKVNMVRKVNTDLMEQGCRRGVLKSMD